VKEVLARNEGRSGWEGCCARAPPLVQYENKVSNASAEFSRQRFWGVEIREGYLCQLAQRGRCLIARLSLVWCRRRMHHGEVLCLTLGGASVEMYGAQRLANRAAECVEPQM